jgi:membrane protein involved in D-alanine export
MLVSPFIDFPFYMVLALWSMAAIIILYVFRYPLYASAVMSFGLWATGAFLGSSDIVVKLFFVVLFHYLLIRASFYVAQKYKKNSKSFNTAFITLYVLVLIPVFLIKIHVFSLLAVSYITFKTMQVLFDIHDRRITSINNAPLLIFLCFFPIAFAGPLDRYERFSGDLLARLSTDDIRLRLERGAKNLWFGLFYKFICAHYVGMWLGDLHIYREFLGFVPFHVVKSYLNGINIILDIAGFSAIAIAFSCFAGIQTPRNVNNPLVSLSLREFWQRCQITLAQWFRDYVFMRLLLYIRRRKLIASPETAAYVSMIITFVLLGAWHGFTLPYILYGLYNGILLSVQEWIDFARKRGKLTIVFPNFLCWLVTFHVVMFGLRIFTL